MLQRFASFAERDPKNAAKVILALAIALTLVILGALMAILDIGGLFEAPYPSETTPLTWDDGSVVWTGVDTVIFTEGHSLLAMGDDDPSDLYEEYGGWGRNYSSIRFTWGHPHGAFGGWVANDSEQQELSAGVLATVESYVGGTFMDGQEVNYSLVVTDLQGNGAFDRGDQITFKMSLRTGTSVYEDEAYTLGLAYLGSQYVYVGEYSFALHDGKFYSWKSSVLNWDQPWWE